MSLSIARVRTDNPEKEIWRYLRLYTHESYIEKFVEDENARKQVVSCLKQAEEIYAISKSVSMLTKPILYYYGMQRLAKSLIFLKNSTINQDDLREHGLTGGGICPDVEKFLDSKIHVARTGIFKEFSKLTTKNRILLDKTVYDIGDYHHNEMWVYDCEITEFLESSEFEVGHLFLLIPEILGLLNYLRFDNNLLIPCHFSIRQHSNGKYDNLITVMKKLDLEALKKKFPELSACQKAKENAYQLTVTSELQDDLVFPKQMVQAETGEIFLLNADSDNDAITDLNVHFVLMFLLSYIARYKAPMLSEIFEGRKRSENPTLIQKFVETSETKFPKLILDEISGSYFVFSQ